MHAGSSKSRYYRELRELHQLYNKCEPVVVARITPGPSLAICTCGRILKHPGQEAWSYDATISHEPGWTRLTHADKRRIKASQKFTSMIKGLRNELQKRIRPVTGDQ